jgi:hypothetical protein
LAVVENNINVCMLLTRKLVAKKQVRACLEKIVYEEDGNILVTSISGINPGH